MNIFDELIRELRGLMEDCKAGSPLFTEMTAGPATWPAGKRGGIVMQSDTAVELGNPREESAALLLWTEDLGLVRDGMVTIIGPDVSACAGRSIPFGKAVVLGVAGFDENICHERHRELELARHDVNLQGYMMRAVSQYMREWSRIHGDALAAGFSLNHLAAAHLERYRRFPYVAAAEMIYFTGSTESVRALRSIGERAARIAAAMNKMAQELSFDCGTCDYSDLCDEVEALKSMRTAMMKEADNG